MEKKRIAVIDTLRGFLLINMTAYHALWDMVYIYGFDIGFYKSVYAHIWQRFICMGFIFISGICRSLGSRHLKRGGCVFMCGLIITAFTLIFMPEDRIIFGILTFLGTAMIILIPFDALIGKIQGKKSIFALALSLAAYLFIKNINDGYVGIGMRINLPEHLYKGYFMTFLGFTDSSFYSSDYFPILPWIALYLCGVFTGTIVKGKSFKAFDMQIKPFGFLGRHSLFVYMVHQPIVYIAVGIISAFLM